MQGTTRSVEVVEGVVASKAMALGRTMLLSVSAGGKSGRGGRFKQRSLPGGHSTASSTIKKKKVCSSSLNESAKLADAAAGLVAMKEEKERIHGHFVCDPSMVEAALTLQEISMEPAINFPWPTSTELSSGHQSLLPALPQWTTRKRRSGRTKRVENSSWTTRKRRNGRTQRVENSSNEGSHDDAIVTDSSSPPPSSPEAAVAVFGVLLTALWRFSVRDYPCAGRRYIVELQHYLLYNGLVH